MPLPTVSPSERSFSPQTVCVWETGLFIARWYKPEIPATKEEVIALAAASGVSDWYTVGRANFTKLSSGIKARYGLVGTVVEGAAAAQVAVAAANLKPCAIGLAGNQLNLTPHWQAGSIGHAIAVFYPAGPTGTQLDPLAPEGYAGDPFTPAEMAKFTTAAIVFAGAPSAGFTPGYKAAGPPIGKVTLTGPHHLISPLNTKQRFPQAAGSVFDVIAALDIRTPEGMPVDIDGASPPLNNRDQVYLLDAANFGVGAWLLRQDGTFTALAADCADEVAAAVAPLNAKIANTIKERDALDAKRKAAQAALA